MHVSALFIYPIKGCRGISLQEAEIDDYGLAGDRRYMVVDPQGDFLSQRQHPMMSRIGVNMRGKNMVLTFEGQPDLLLDPQPSADTMRVRIWDDLVTAHRMEDVASRWLSEIMGLPCHLVTIGAAYERKLKESKTHRASEMHFGDSSPVLVTTTASLEDLNGRLDQPVPMDRFRPNVVVDAADPYEEDTWRSFEIAGIQFQFVKKCGRCTVTTIDQQSGIPSKEPLRTLSTYRKDGTKVCFGSYYVPTSRGTIALGDPVQPER